MPRVTSVKKAQKAQGACGKCGVKIKVGDSYCWWKFRYGGRRVRCDKPGCAPKASDLTQSEFYSRLYDIQESIEDAIASGEKDTLVDALRSAAEDIRSLGEECQEKRDNMPEQLQESETGELLGTRADECESHADELESAADEVESREMLEADEWQEYAESEGIGRDEGESDEDYEQRVRELITDENAAALEVDVDLSIG